MKQHNVIIYVMSDGDRTVAEASMATDYGRLTGSGSSARRPGDKQDKSVGEDLAVARAVESLERKLTRRASGIMKHREDIAAHRQEIRDRERLGKGGNR